MRTQCFFGFALLVGCSLEPVPSDAGPPDAGRPWPHDRGSLAGQTRRGYHLARSIVHLHSPLSHDACDGEGWVDGALADAGCLAHLREAACRLSMDVLFLTDHAPHMNELTIERALWIADGDEAIRGGDGSAIAARWACPGSSHRTLVMVGSENAMMPIGLLRHPDAPPGGLESVYDRDGAEAAAAFRAAGALVFYAHTESKTLDQIRASQPDGIEIYNLHANVGPDIRQQYLGLEPFSYVPMLLRFTQPRHGLEPDLAILSFVSENEPSLRTWDTLLAEGMRLSGVGGCDAHENTFTMRMPDGERGDSFRRMMVWQSQHLLVDGDGRDEALEALARGRSYLAFEVLGTPIGFDFRAESGVSITEMGEDIELGARLIVVRPSLPDDFPQAGPPAIRMRIMRAAAGGAIEVASGDGATLEYVAREAGAYRAEVRITPEHARPYLGSFAGELVRELVWVYSNPIHVGASR